VEQPATLSVPLDSATPAPALAEARAWCRATLPTVSRTFALNIRLLSGSMRDAVRIAYLLCRVADTIEDAWPGDRGEIERRFEQLIVAVHGDAVAACALASGAAALEGRASEAHAALVHALPTVLRCFAELDAGDRADIAEAVSIMARGMGPLCRPRRRAHAWGRAARRRISTTSASCAITAGSWRAASV
jgi:farnesyl-diphosphate farnesyltransferase